MLSQPDADLVRREGALPGLGVALDAEALGGLLGAAWPEAVVGSARSTYIRHKPGTSCIVAYDVTIDGQPRSAYVKVLPPGAAALEKARLRPLADHAPRPRPVVFPDLGLVVRPFPHDGEVKSLWRLGHAGTRAKLLRDVGSQEAGGEEAALEPLAYKPERRFVAACTPAHGSAATLRLYTDHAYARARIAVEAFHSRGALRVPRRLGHADRRRALLVEWIPGQVLGEWLPSRDRGVGSLVGRAGAGLAALHQQTVSGLPVLTRVLEATSLQAVVDGVAFVCPEASASGSDLGRRLAAALANLPQVVQPIHGDFYAKQVVATRDEAAVLDLDDAALGDPAADLGNFIAHLELEALRGRLSSDAAASYGAAFVDGYASEAPPPDADRLRLYVAAALLRLVPRPFRDREPDWPERTLALIDRVRVLAETPAGSVRASRRPAAPARRTPSVDDPFDVTTDQAMRFLVPALDPAEAGQEFTRRLPGYGDSPLHVRAIRVTRYKPGRRCLLEYDVECGEGERTWVAKARAKGLDEATPRLQDELWSTTFGDGSADGASVPRVVGVVPDWRLWLQEKSAGRRASDELTGSSSATVAGRIARALCKLHASGTRPSRVHTEIDEMAILRDRLGRLAADRPAWQSRIARVLDACARLAEGLRADPACPIHRDFYADQVLVDRDRVVLLDFDTCALGHPAIDAGNFLAHLIDQGLRAPNRSRALGEAGAAFEDTFLRASPGVSSASVEAGTTLALARLVHVSTLFDDRRPFTEALLDLCERRLGCLSPLAPDVAIVGATG